MVLKIKAKEIGNYEWGYSQKHYMPILTLVCADKDDNEIVTGYLSPFRGYSFQVSASFTGSVDLGASQVVGLANIKVDHWGEKTATAVTNSNCSLTSITKELLKGLMLDAITDFAEYPHEYHRWAIGDDVEIADDEELIITGFKDLKRSDMFKDYAAKVYDYLWPQETTVEE